MNIQINPQYDDLSEFIACLPDIFPHYGEVVQKGRNTIKTFKVNGIVLNVKSFKVPIWINRIAYKYFRKSKAERSFIYAKRLLENGVNTPDPVAFVETSEKGLFACSYYVSIHETVDGTIRDIYTQPESESRSLVKAFTAFTARLHKKGVFHKDYSPGNIMYKKTDEGYEFYLVDLNRIEFKEIKIFDSCKSFRRIRMDEDTIKTVANEYSGIRRYSKTLCEWLIGYYNRIFWKKYLNRHPEVLQTEFAHTIAVKQA